ncbi:tRNA-specific adenosine deaminase 1 [Actinomortierella ambigua]|nr:tRNA-specific adenosine deaminase 1 [Actinomortierella ambigua]
MSLAFRRGRLDYGCITALRTKPGRVDSEPTLSMSCSDKMARWNVLGLTSALVVSLLDRPLYLDAIVSHELFDADALHRALYARIEQAAASGERRCSTSPLEKEIKERKEEQEKGNVDNENDDQQDQQDSIYHLHRPKIWYTSQVFEFSKEAVCGLADQEQQQQQQQSSSSSDIVAPSRLPPPPPTASPNGMSWTAGLPVEVIVNGCKAGASAKQSSATRPLPEKSQSRLCKSQLYSTSLRLWKQVAVHREEGGRGVGGGDMTGTKSYQTWKQQIAPAYHKAKTRLLQGVMRHWVKGLSELEQFDDHGSIVPSSHETSHGG